MSLIIMARYDSGIIASADPFFFDNDGGIPQKGLDFNKFIISDRHKLIMAGVGSAWVLAQAGKWLESQPRGDFKTLLLSLAEQWATLNNDWLKSRETDIEETEVGTLRPLSGSTCLLARQADLARITIVDGEGRVHSSPSFVMSGSGSAIVSHYMKNSGNKFTPEDHLADSLNLIFDCYRAARSDLYVLGFPIVVIVTKDRIKNHAIRCQHIWESLEVNYFNELREAIHKSE